MKTKDVVAAFAALDGAKLGKMEDKEKFTLVKALKALRPIKKAYEEFVNDARERLKGDDFETMQERAVKWNEQHRGQLQADLTPEEQAELKELNEYFQHYQDSVNECVSEEAEKEVTADYTRLSEEAFGRLLASNPDMRLEDVMRIEELLVE